MKKECVKCGAEMYRDEKGRWFCPDCILEGMDPAFLDESRADAGELTKPFVFRLPTKPVSIRIPIADLERARKLASKKGIPKYQTYLKTLLHDALIKEEGQTYSSSQPGTARKRMPSKS